MYSGLSQKSAIKDAIDEYHRRTCIKFRPATEDDVDYVKITVRTIFSSSTNTLVNFKGWSFHLFWISCVPPSVAKSSGAMERHIT